MRAMNDAILIGIGTACADDPVLTCRLPGMAARSPVRVILDSRLRLPRDGRLARTARDTPVWVLASPLASAETEAALTMQGIQVFRIGASEKGLDLAAALRLLSDNGITRLMVEGGPKIAAAFLAADLVDEAVLFRAPKPIGADGIDAIEGQGLDALTRSPHLTSVGDDRAGIDSIEFFERA
jgi:diaminohydroxyphosphoribosylaminopyrimidine deaminase/5-amino-6-(5-phosphoribosylamino)uracil reductase